VAPPDSDCLVKVSRARLVSGASRAQCLDRGRLHRATGVRSTMVRRADQSGRGNFAIGPRPGLRERARRYSDTQAGGSCSSSTRPPIGAAISPCWTPITGSSTARLGAERGVSFSINGEPSPPSGRRGGGERATKPTIPQYGVAECVAPNSANAIHLYRRNPRTQQCAWWRRPLL